MAKIRPEHIHVKGLRKGVYFTIDSKAYPNLKDKIFKIIYREYDKIHCYDIISKQDYAQTISVNAVGLIQVLNKKDIELAKVLYE